MKKKKIQQISDCFVAFKSENRDNVECAMIITRSLVDLFGGGGGENELRCYYYVIVYFFVLGEPTDVRLLIHLIRQLMVAQVR